MHKVDFHHMLKLHLSIPSSTKQDCVAASVTNIQRKVFQKVPSAGCRRAKTRCYTVGVVFPKGIMSPEGTLKLN